MFWAKRKPQGLGEHSGPKGNHRARENIEGPEETTKPRTQTKPEGQGECRWHKRITKTGRKSEGLELKNKTYCVPERHFKTTLRHLSPEFLLLGRKTRL